MKGQERTEQQHAQVVNKDYLTCAEDGNKLDQKHFDEHIARYQQLLAMLKTPTFYPLNPGLDYEGLAALHLNTLQRMREQNNALLVPDDINLPKQRIDMSGDQLLNAILDELSTLSLEPVPQEAQPALLFSQKQEIVEVPALRVSLEDWAQISSDPLPRFKRLSDETSVDECLEEEDSESELSSDWASVLEQIKIFELAFPSTSSEEFITGEDLSTSSGFTLTELETSSDEFLTEGSEESQCSWYVLSDSGASSSEESWWTEEHQSDSSDGSWSDSDQDEPNPISKLKF